MVREGESNACVPGPAEAMMTFGLENVWGRLDLRLCFGPKLYPFPATSSPCAPIPLPQFCLRAFGRRPDNPPFVGFLEVVILMVRAGYRIWRGYFDRCVGMVHAASQPKAKEATF